MNWLEWEAALSEIYPEVDPKVVWDLAIQSASAENALKDAWKARLPDDVYKKYQSVVQAIHELQASLSTIPESHRNMMAGAFYRSQMQNRERYAKQTIEDRFLADIDSLEIAFLAGTTAFYSPRKGENRRSVRNESIRRFAKIFAQKLKEKPVASFDAVTEEPSPFSRAVNVLLSASGYEELHPKYIAKILKEPPTGN